MHKNKYRGLISSDWSGCLSPSGPFDPMTWAYPELKSKLDKIFRSYTANRISLGSAADQLRDLLPQGFSSKLMDDYLEASFSVYPGVDQLIDWCLQNNILFMINTTGMIGYFQRVWAKGLLPKIPVLSANPLIRYRRQDTDPQNILPLLEIEDKSANSEKVMDWFSIIPSRTILMGDSGGDGPHFEWGWNKGVWLIGNMSKHSLIEYCRLKGIHIHKHFGRTYQESEKRDIESEKQVNFMQLTAIIEDFLQS